MPLTVIKKLTRADYRDMALLGQTDLFYLIRYILGYPDFDENTQGKMAEHIMSVGPDSGMLLLCPRGVFKSTLCSIGFPLFVIARTATLFDGTPPNYPEVDPYWGDRRIHLLTYKKRKSADYLAELVGHITGDGSLYRYLYRGPFGQALDDVPDDYRWSKYSIEVATRKVRRAAATIEVGGIMAVDTGKHTDDMVYDDVVDPRFASRDTEQQRILEGFRQSVPLVDPGGRSYMLGTTWDTKDLYAYVEKNKKKFRYKVLKMTALDKKTGEAVFPKIFTKEFLEKQRDVLEEDFDKNYMMDPSNKKARPFSKVLYIHPDRMFKDNYTLLQLNDFNDSKLRRSHWTAAALVAYGMLRNTVTVLAVRMVKGPAEENADVVVSLGVEAMDKWAPRLRNVDEQRVSFRGLYYEAYAGQKLMRFPLRMAIARARRPMALHPLPLERSSKEDRIRSMFPRVKAGGVFFNVELKTEPQMMEAVAQWSQFPGHEYDDFPDALSQINQVPGLLNVTDMSEVNALPDLDDGTINWEQVRIDTEKALAQGELKRALEHSENRNQELDESFAFDGFVGDPDAWS